MHRLIEFFKATLSCHIFPSVLVLCSSWSETRICFRFKLWCWKAKFLHALASALLCRGRRGGGVIAVDLVPFILMCLKCKCFLLGQQGYRCRSVSCCAATPSCGWIESPLTSFLLVKVQRHLNKFKSLSRPFTQLLSVLNEPVFK